jgi:hypothetical protein
MSERRDEWLDTALTDIRHEYSKRRGLHRVV